MKPWIDHPFCKNRSQHALALCALCRADARFQNSMPSRGWQNPRDAICPEGFKLGEVPPAAIEGRAKLIAAIVAPAVKTKLPHAKPTSASSAATIPRLSSRPGDLLTWLIHFTLEIPPCATCQARAEKMNDWGWLGCWRERRAIVSWLAEQSRARHFAPSSASNTAAIVCGLRAALRSFTLRRLNWRRSWSHAPPPPPRSRAT